MIPVTKPFLPPKEEVYQLLDQVWERQWLTNNGPLVNEFEDQLKKYLGLPHLLFVNNGTLALQIAIKALGLSGEIITTPFSFIATSNCIVWEGCKPVFVDICADSFNLDPSLIEAAITPATTAILATHVFGNPCAIDEIAKIATKHKLKVIYDAAHCFGSSYQNQSVFAYGDISITSFHATKLFHTVEGGGLFSNSVALIEKMAFLRNFGYNGPHTFAEVGINGKNSEFHAAMGLANIKYIDEILDKRKSLSNYYRGQLQDMGLQFQELNTHSNYNHSYMPVVFQDSASTSKVVEALEANHIFPRRYFYPSLNTIPLFNASESCQVSESIASRILCLPLYHTLTPADIDFIVLTIKQSLSS
ncbi:DegT/DnrJ/EryC1/StrS family aminotransferase [Pedobacter sp. KR3-3]|uniref:DegT/DnrJ/EryC1/StrS family aminotransferase n=1 Tax=Pedobacter albus TaxID=3113905 RepID=A0ABU7I6Q3_9SPHI|nr:DegT/DnrJ/EryC1/StrS family aminotransferase [Pedobacter sp. KR3-3]MEE1945128.1 DegT/DnrJ/EryC1/StrS family aminotransferase [Pedobacter sp. KR3-3]